MLSISRALTLVVLGVSLAWPAVAQAAIPDIAKLNLQLSDMPTGFTQSKNQVLNVAGLAKVVGRSPAALARAGRTLTSSVQFDTNAIFGTRAVTGEVAAYNTAANAEKDFNLSFVGGASKRWSHPVPMSVDPVGIERAGFKVTFTSSGVRYTQDIVMFHRDAYAAQVTTVAVEGTDDPVQTLAFARLIDGGILAASGTPNPAPAPASTAAGHPVHLVFRYTGNTLTDTFGESPNFQVRGPVTVGARVSALDTSKVATALGIYLNNNITNFVGDVADSIAIDVHGSALTFQEHFTDPQCQFGCSFDMLNATNMRWDIRVEQ
jgi:hypothetical protein